MCTLKNKKNGYETTYLQGWVAVSNEICIHDGRILIIEHFEKKREGHMCAKVRVILAPAIY